MILVRMGSILGSAGPSWGHLGDILEPSWGSQPTIIMILVPVGSILGMCWAVLGSSWDYPGALGKLPADEYHDTRAWGLPGFLAGGSRVVCWA